MQEWAAERLLAGSRFGVGVGEDVDAGGLTVARGWILDCCGPTLEGLSPEADEFAVPSVFGVLDLSRKDPHAVLYPDMFPFFFGFRILICFF